MKNNKRNHAFKAAVFSLLGILLLTGIYLGVNRFIFASATDREIHLEPFQPMEATQPQATLLTRLEAVPEGYPFPEFSIFVPDGVEELMTPSTISSDQAATIISRYIWEMHGTDISGKIMFLGLESFPSSTRTHWQGHVWSPHDFYGMVIHYNFSIDSVTGERIAILINDWFPAEALGEDLSGASHETLVDFYTEIARDFAQRHFHFTEVVSVTYEGMRRLEDYQTQLICECREPNPCPTQTLIHDEFMYYYESGDPMLENRFGYSTPPTIQCQECRGGINQTFTYIAGNWPCHAIMSGETMLDFIATDDTGRSARIAVSMGARRLNSLTTQHNDIVPGFELRPDPDPSSYATHSPSHDPSDSLYPEPGPHFTLYLDRGPMPPDQQTWSTQIPPSTDFNTFYMDPIHTLSLTPRQDLLFGSSGWELIRIVFADGRSPLEISAIRRQVEDIGPDSSMESVEIRNGGWQEASSDYSFYIFDDGYDYFYFLRIVWEEGFTFQVFRINSANLPGYTPPELEYNPASEDTEQDPDTPAGVVWLVPPTLNHGHIQQCNCGQFVNQDWQTIDPLTGEIVGDHLGHGGPLPGFVYDQAHQLFGHPGYGFGYHDLLGMHPINEFIEMLVGRHVGFDQWRNPIDGLITVESVDFSMRQYYELEYVNQYNELVVETFWYLPPEAFTGRFALMNNGQFLTDFIFDGVSYQFIDWQRSTGPDVIAVSQNGRWGLVNWRGDTVIPFMFENMVVIPHSSAFVRYNGRYGILDLPMTGYNLRDA